ncbi:alpha-L-rhamnosidase C-terminal domain-containing protein [Terracidiphilus sp.]|uniref:alpha-L-rhamnosidase-related protein n=1 Tax=Terracidiphilus sp. TaxID=1964191 RepID=UPI003C29D7C2
MIVTLLWATAANGPANAPLNAQATAQPDPPTHSWHASWITHPTAPLREPIVLHFRRMLSLPTFRSSYIVRVSADNRFILYVNGKRIGDGPARGDLTHWRYETFDLAPYLHTGDNAITATVWNFGVYAPIAQISDRTAFLLESEATGEQSISTPENWQVEIEPGHIALDRSSVSFKEYMAAGPGEEIDASKYDWTWNGEHVSRGRWVDAGDPMRDSIYPGNNHAHSAETTGDNPWGLVPDGLPHMEYTQTSSGEVVRVSLDDINVPPSEPPIPQKSTYFRDFPATSVSIGPGGHARILLDRKTLTTAYPQLTVSGGKGATIKLTYTEALYDKNRHKGDRDATDYRGSDGQMNERQALGLTDIFLPDGGQHRTFEPLWWRTWRYLALDITTADEPLQLESLKAFFTAYPFEEKAKLTTPDPDLAKIWEISWRTARLDAHETYMDTPYWEQLQYVGDTRIQSLISYTVANDDRLGRQALEAFDHSRLPEGITRSRYPSSLPQNIPTFSLLYIGMLHDFWIYRDDPHFVRNLLPGTRSILGWFQQHETKDGLLEKLPWWSFIDWVSSGEIPTYSTSNESCATTLEYLGALNDAADLEQALGDPVLATRDKDQAETVRRSIYSQCWSPDRNLLADNPDKKVFSQQSNVLAVLYDVIPKADQQTVLKKILTIEPGTTPDGILSASYYFRFYLARALDHANMADSYLQSLDPWRKLLPLHFSTWPEIPGNTRSDSHAWTSHPIYDLLTLVAGIEPSSPSFKTVRIAPHLGTLPTLKATFPHPEGEISVDYQRHGDTLDATITLPGSLTGTFVLGSQQKPLHPGLNHISVSVR